MSVNLGFVNGLVSGTFATAGGHFFGNKIKDYSGIEITPYLSGAAVTSTACSHFDTNPYSLGFINGVALANAIATPIITVISQNLANLKERHIKQSISAGVISGLGALGVTSFVTYAAVQVSSKGAISFVAGSLGTCGLFATACASYYVAKKALNSQWFAKKCE